MLSAHRSKPSGLNHVPATSSRQLSIAVPPVFNTSSLSSIRTRFYRHNLCLQKAIVDQSRAAFIWYGRSLQSSYFVARNTETPSISSHYRNATFHRPLLTATSSSSARMVSQATIQRAKPGWLEQTSSVKHSICSYAALLDSVHQKIRTEANVFTSGYTSRNFGRSRRYHQPVAQTATTIIPV